MELTELKRNIISAFRGSSQDLELLLDMFERDKSFFPFNEYEFLLVSMLDKQGITYEDYLNIRNDYLAHNPNLWVFEISAPRAFGEKYGQTILQTMSLELKTPSKELDADYHGQYDLWYDGIRIEVKASRATDKDSDEPLYKKALATGTKKNFLMNFQQLKPQCCDVFVWLAVYRDATIIWVMSSNEVMNHPDYSKGQHRGNLGNEGQLHITQSNIATLDKYKVKNGNLLDAIKNAGKRNTK